DDWTSGAELIRRVSAEGAWKSVRELALRDGLFALLARSLHWAHLELGEKAPILDELQLLRRNVCASNLRLKAELFRIGAGFDDARIPFVPIKGLVLAAEVLGDLSLRSFVDQDILVPEEAVSEAVRVLGELGYVQN